MFPIQPTSRLDRAGRVLVAVLTLAALAACGSSPAKRNPRFSPAPQRPLALLVDVVYFRDDAVGDTDAVDVDSSAAFARALAERVNADLRARGYPGPSRLFLTSGIAFDSAADRVVVNHAVETGAAPRTTTARAPCWTDSASSEVRPALRTLVRALHAIEHKANATNDRPPVVAYDGRALGLPDSTRLLTLDVFVRDVSTGKQVKQGILTAVATGGLLVAHTTSVFQVGLHAVEPSGEVTWIARRYFKGGRGSREQVEKIGAKVASELP